MGLYPLELYLHLEKIKIRKNLKNTKTLLEDWVQDSYYIRNIKGHTFSAEYTKSNSEIQGTKIKVDRIIKHFEFNNIPFSENIFLEKFGKDEVKIGIDFFESFEDFIIASKHRKTEGTINR